MARTGRAGVRRVADGTVRGRKECFCNYQFDVKACSIQGIYKTSDVVKNDGGSLACKPGTVDVMSKIFLVFTSQIRR